MTKPLAIGLALLLVVSPAMAAPLTKAQEKLARLHFQAGKQAFELGRYADAALEFQRGYDLSHLPLFLLNLAHAHFSMEHFGDAITALEQYLGGNPNDPVHVHEAEELLDSAKRRKAEEDAKTPATAAPAPTPPTEAAPTPPPPEATPAPKRGPARPALAWTGVVGLVLGAGAVAGGAALLVTARNLNDQFNHPATGTVYDPSVVSTFQGEHAGGIALVAAGGALLVVGTTLAVLGFRHGRDGAPSAWLAPSVAPGSAGAALGFRF